VTISVWEHAAAEGRNGAAAYYSSLGGVWDFFLVPYELLFFAWRTLRPPTSAPSLVPADTRCGPTAPQFSSPTVGCSHLRRLLLLRPRADGLLVPLRPLRRRDPVPTGVAWTQLHRRQRYVRCRSAGGRHPPEHRRVLSAFPSGCAGSCSSASREAASPTSHRAHRASAAFVTESDDPEPSRPTPPPATQWTTPCSSARPNPPASAGASAPRHSQ
jgi:hypothetical protein